MITAVLAGSAGGTARAQATTGPAVLYAQPGARELATVARGTVLDPGKTSGEYTMVTLHGFISTSLLGGKRDSFPATVSATDARLRAGPSTSAAVVASLQQGMGVRVLKRQGTWAEVERTGWLRRSAFPAAPSDRKAAPASSKTVVPPSRQSAPVQAPVSPTSAPATPAQGDSGHAVPAGAVTPAATTALVPAPGLAPVAQLQPGAALVPVARDRGWVQVRVEGWVKEGDLVAADSSVGQLTAADLRANPDQYVGKTVRWEVTSLAFQTADPLRKDMRPDEPYLLARGPGKENALLYLALPESLVAKARGLPPMTALIVSARVRTGRAEPSGVPILDVQSLALR